MRDSVYEIAKECLRDTHFLSENQKARAHKRVEIALQNERDINRTLQTRINELLSDVEVLEYKRKNSKT